MKSHHKNNVQKVVLVISDLHLSAGKMFKGKRNLLEDFHYDRELIDFLNYYSTGDYAELEVELIINGDFLDFLAVPYVEFYDDEFWSEKAALAKLHMIMSAHKGVLDALKRFLSHHGKSIVYIIGNHDAEFVFESVKEDFLAYFGPLRDRLTLSNQISTYKPVKGVSILHGHQYEVAHDFDQENAVVETLRFMLSNFYYFIMVRFWHYYLMKRSLRKVIGDLLRELELFQDFETLTRQYFETNQDTRVLIVGHTHNPTLRIFNDGTIFINTGTWTRMVNLDLAHWNNGNVLTYAKILVKNKEYALEDFDQNVEVDLKQWSGMNAFPYSEYQ